MSSNPDTLICGNCRECFNELAELLDHKRSYCKLRFTCKCQDVAFAAKTPPSSAKLLCAVCKDAFVNPWDLMVHAQAAHMVNIYELGNEANNNNCNTNCGSDAAAPLAINDAVSNNNNNSNITAAMVTTKDAHPTLEANNNNSKNTSGHNEIQMSPTMTTTVAAAAAITTIATASATSSVATTTTTAAATLEAMDTNSENDVGVLDIGVIGGGSSSICNNSIVDDGNVSDSVSPPAVAHCMDIKFGICNSPLRSVVKEETQRDEASLDGQMSISSQAHHSDDMKLLNGSLSSRDSSPALDNDEQQPRACIVRALSIEAATATTPISATRSLGGIMTSSLALSLTNGAANAAAAIVPQ